MSVILVVDDDPDVAELVCLSFEYNGHRVRVAGDGATALELARRDPPDAVVLDWYMPGLNGGQVCALLRGDRRTREVPVVILTVDDTPDRIEAVRIAGANAHMAKPFSPRELVALVNSLLGAHHDRLTSMHRISS